MKRRIRILSLIGDLYFGGDQSRLLAFARTIDHDRFDHKVVTINRADAEIDPRYGTMRQQFADAEVDLIDLGESHSKTKPTSIKPVQVARTGLVLFRLVQTLSRLIRDLRVDVVDAHVTVGGIVGVLAGRLTGTRTVVTLYQTKGWEVIEAVLIRLSKRITVTMADAVVTDSQAGCECIQKSSMRSNLTVSVIPNGIFPPSTHRTRDEMREILGLPKDPIIQVIGQVSRLTPSKGHMVLLAAARLVLEKWPNAVFLFVGYETEKDSYKKRLENEAAKLGISDHVRIVSYPGYIGDVWKSIDIHVHASLFDSLPNAIIEGMSLAKPAVATSIGGIPEMIEHERTGLIVPPGNSEALSCSLLRLLRDPEMSKELGKNARKRYSMQYRPEVMTRKLELLFANLVG